MAIFKTLLLALPALALAAPTSINPRSTGSMTWYTPGLGACGQNNGENELVCAMSAGLYDANSPCGKSIKITGPAGSVTVKVVDRCVGCAYDDIDLSPAAFQKAIGELGIGRKNAQWEWA
ncbi:Non-catalytic module family expansin [Thelonectria olida]|uniref:Non-catalytic module family expansin n=1 Tax=Thelonectria olida TaxID=1576542 RepID=A0A9P8WEZ2_9HYPO|nr:Non-catalytic module family expansin [Thelonectria olida]